MNTITPERLREFTATLQKYKSGKASLERRVVAAENWWKLRNRFEEAKAGIGDDGGFRSVSGWLHNVIVSKHADAMDAFPEPIILPRESGDRLQAELLSAVIPCVLEQNRFEKTYDAAMWQKLKTGTALYRVGWDGTRHGGLGDIAIERVDLLNIFWEPGLSDIQKSPYVFHTHLEDERALEEQFPQLRGRLKSSPFMATRFVYDDAVSTEGKCTVIEVYYKKRGKLHYCKYVGDTVLFATENACHSERFSPCHSERSEESRRIDSSVVSLPQNDRGGKCHSERSEESYQTDSSLHSVPFRMTGVGKCHSERSEKSHRTDSSVTAFPQNDKRGVENDKRGVENDKRGVENDKRAVHDSRGLYAHGRYPFVFDPLFPVEGSPCGYGFVDLCHNAQTAIDLMRSAFIKNTMVGATPRYFQRVDGSVNEEEFADLSRAIVHVNGNLGEDSLRQIGFAGLPGAYLSVLESSIQELRETSGNTNTATGNVNAGVTAASAIAALQEASSKGSRDSIRASYAAFSEIVELCIELIREFYTLPRQFRIAGRMGGDDFVSYSNAALQPRPAGFVGGVGIGLSVPVFDVKVGAQKRNAYSRLSQNELAMELYRLGVFEPGREQQAISCLRLMEFDGKEELMRRIAAGAGLQEKLAELGQYKALAERLTERYRPDMAAGLGLGAGENGLPHQ